MDKEAVVYINNGMLLNHINKYIWVNANEVDEPRAYYIEWSKSERGKQISYINTYVWNLERWYWWTYLEGSNWDTDIENRLMNLGVGWGEEEGGTNGESSMETYTLP